RRALRRPFYLSSLLVLQLFKKNDELCTLRVGQARRDPALVQLDAPLQALNQGASGARQPQPVGAAVFAASPLNQAAAFERVDDAHHGRAIQVNGAREPALRHARIRLDEEQDADAAGGNLAHAGSEVAEHRLLREAQAIAEQSRQPPGAQRVVAAHFVWAPNNLVP